MEPLKKTYFHVSPLLLEPQSMISPGNFGRIINKQGANHHLYLREMLLEGVRIKYFTNKPSRFSAIFACLDLNEARFYRDTQQQFNSVIYEVSVVNPLAKFHIGCYNQLPGITGDPETIAIDYWNGNPIVLPGFENYKCEELIVESPLKIIAIVNEV